jgi:cbb3-type cytochrome oxidase subunit 3
MTYEIIVQATLWVELIFFNIKKYLGVVYVFVAKKKKIKLYWN